MARRSRRMLYKRKLQKEEEEEEEEEEKEVPQAERSRGGEEEEEEEEDSSRNGCCTPKGKRFRIPEVSTCPPAPKKTRVVPDCLTKRSPIPFFAPPDIELFFFFAFRNNIS